MKLLILVALNKNDWIAAVFLLLLMLLGVVKYIYKERLVELLLVFFTKRYFLDYSKENPLIFNGFNSILFVVQLVVLALVGWLYAQFYRPELIDEKGYLFFLKCVGALGLFFAIRFFLGYLLASLFEINNLHLKMLFAKASYFYALSTLLLPFLFLIFYAKSYNLLFFQLTVLVLIILLIARYVFVFKNNKNEIISRLFYFILYLCALEIAPLLLFFKILSENNI